MFFFSLALVEMQVLQFVAVSVINGENFLAVNARFAILKSDCNSVMNSRCKYRIS